MKKLIQSLKNKKIIIFGAGNNGKIIFEWLPIDILYFVDNDKSKWGTKIENIEIREPRSILHENRDEVIVLIASLFYLEIEKQLEEMGLKKDLDFANGLKIAESFGKIDCGGNSVENTMSAALIRMKQLGIEFNTVIDIGASNGMWSKLAMYSYPEKSYYLIEARKEHEEHLKEMKLTSKNVDYVLAAAGDIEGEIYFNASEDLLGGAASHDKFAENCIVTPMVTVDDCVTRKNLKPPYLIKLDTHGFEMPIFKGAEETLKSTELVVIEVYNFNINGGVRFHEMCAFMETKGFRCIDLVDPMLRPKDNAFWQMDLFFIKKDNELFNSLSFY